MKTISAKIMLMVFFIRERSPYEVVSMHRLIVSLIISALLLLHTSPQSVRAQSNKDTQQFDASKVEVMVVGSLHLRQINISKTPILTELIRQSLQKYAPDHVVVEWLHPSIDPASTFNYKPLGDFETLSRLWGYELSKAGEALESTKQLLQQHKQLDTQSRSTSDIRLELGKLYYLTKEQLNAAYQWWQAQQLGADVKDLRRLTSNNLKGHELEVFGFEIARRQGLEYITPFDYQGSEAGSEVWGIILTRLRALALKQKHGVVEKAPTWEALATEFDKARRAFEEKSDKTLAEKYGDIKEVREYIEAWEGFNWANGKMPAVRDGLSQMVWLQGPEYEAVERRVQTELIPGISIGGLGSERLKGIARRNERMMDFAEADIRRLGTKRVMIIVGAQHKFYLEDLIKQRGYRLIHSSEFMP